MENKPAPEIYWIVGDGTSVGKTTLACALIRALNAAGTPAAGFKPYAAMRLDEVTRLVADLAPSPWRLRGEDALELARASPLTTPEMGDIVGPAQFVCDAHWPSAVLARTGSMALDNVEYFSSDQALPVAERLDILAVLEKTGLPLGTARRLDTLNFYHAAALSPEKQKLAFDCLIAQGAAAIVCEGPGRFMPNWQDCPGANHVISIAGGRATFFARADCRITFSQQSTLAPASELAAWLDRSRKPSYVAALQYAGERERRKEAADSMAQELLRISAAAAGLN